MGSVTPSKPDPGNTPPDGGNVSQSRNNFDRQFRTDHLLPNLKQRTVSSAAVTLSSQAVKLVVTMGSTAVMARLLTPADFGLVAQVTAVTGFLQVFREAGLSVATIQREDITHAQVSNLFWINVGISLLLTTAIVAIAPLLAWFFRDDRLAPLAIVLSVTYLIGGSGVQHRALLQRQMRFHSKALIDIGAVLTSVIAGIGMALMGYRYWSLVGAALTMETTGLVLTWAVSRWRPQLPQRNVGTSPLIKFGAARTVGDFLLAVSKGCDKLLIGRFYQAEAVGLYTRASALLIGPQRQILLPFNTVFIPTLSRLQNQPQRYRQTFLRLYGGIALLSFFSTGMLFALARPVTLFMLGDQWGAAVPILGGFTFAALCIPLTNSAGWLFISQGRGMDMLKSQAAFSIATVAGFVAGIPFGPVGVAIGFSAANLFIRLPITYWMVGRSGAVSTADLWKVCLRHFPVWLTVYAASTAALAFAGDRSPFGQLAIAGSAGCLAGIIFVLALKAQRDVALYFVDNLRAVVKRRK